MGDDPGFQSKHFHPTRAARAGTPAWAGIRQRFQRFEARRNSHIEALNVLDVGLLCAQAEMPDAQ
jgi:hypothetical protein